MTEAAGSSGDRSGGMRTGRLREGIGRSPRWSKAMLGAAVLVMVLGVVWPWFRGGGEPERGARDAAPMGVVDSFAAGEAPGSGEAEGASEGGAGNTAFRLGFSFAAAFAAAFALRAFFNFTLASAGLFLALLLGLQYAGIIEVRWVAFEGKYESIAAWLESQFSSMQSFVEGALPSSAAAAAGLFAGWRRR